MPPAMPTSPRARSARGQVSWVTLLILALVSGTVYMGWVWAPLYIVHFEVKQVVHDYMNQAVKDHDDAGLVVKMTQKLRVLDELRVVQEDGSVERTPAVEVDPADVTWEADRTSDPKTLHVAFEYTRQVRYPILDRVDEKVFAIDINGELDVPNWGPAR